MNKRPQDTSAEEPDGRNPHIWFRGGPGLGNRPRLVNNAVIAAAPVDSSTDVEAVLNYTRNTGVKQVIYMSDPPPGVPRNSGEIDPRAVIVHDARRAGDLALDVSGFESISHHSALTDWTSCRDSERVTSVCYSEAEAAIKACTGADKVLILGHTLRDSTAEPGEAAWRGPVRRVHDDQTFESAPKWALEHLEPEEAARRLQRRFAMINFWRPIGGAVLQAPLAVCDARTIDPQDLLPSDLVYPDWTAETYAFAFNPQHRWYWYPYQTPAEATLLKVFDSATDGRARLTAHTAFDDPTSPPSAPPRRSIELRSLVFW